MKWWMVKFLRLWDLWINRYESRQIKQPFGIIFLMNWIHKTGNLKTCVQIESTNQIFKCRTCKSGFASLQIQIGKDSWHSLPRICEDSLDSLNLLKISWIHDPQYKPNPDSWSTNQNKSLKVRIRDQRFKRNPWICEKNLWVPNSLIWFLQPYKFLINFMVFDEVIFYKVICSP